MLVRDEFPGKRVVNALIDLPFALPTIVAGVVLLALYGKSSPVGIDVAFTRAAVGLALLFVTLPFVVRSVQPVLLELDRSMEEAAGLARRGAGDGPAPDRAADPRAGDPLGRRAELRARGRRVRLARADHGQPAVQDRGRLGLHLQPDRERQLSARRPSRSSLLLARWSCSACSRALAPEVAHVRWRSSSSRAAAPRPAATPAVRAQARRLTQRLAAHVALGYLALLLLAPVAMIFYRTFEHGLGPGVGTR